jgi:nitroreductase
MEFTEVIKNRYSVRDYKPVPVEEEKLNEVLEAARLAPTACNRQPFQFIVIHTKGKEEDLKRIYRGAWFAKAPVIICACAVPSESWVRSDGTIYYFIDLAIAVDHLVLAATNLGLGTCWVGAFDVKAAEPGTKYRKPSEELVRYEHY